MLHLDIETFSSVDIRAGVYRYCESPDFDVLMCAWSYDGGPVRLALTREEILAIPGLLDPTVTKVAHNAPFERICLSRYTGVALPAESFRDTMALAAESGLPQSLDRLAEYLGGEKKDKAGTRLINLFSKPNRGKRVKPEDKPEEWQQFCDYCVQDVVTLQSVDEQLPDFPTERERQVYLADQAINDRGIAVDLEMAAAAVECSALNQIEAELEVTALTGIDNPSSVQQLLKWIRGSGLPLEDLRAETVETALASDSLTPAQRRVLELRQELALVAGKKFQTALEYACADGRLRGALRFHGAHTGRWAGRGVQLHNLPRAQVDHPESSILDLLMGEQLGNEELKGLVRSLFVGPFTVVDYSAIEARVVAWLAGEEWALQAFRDGRDIYVETAERMGGLTRAQGKVAVLALGYNGAVNSLRAMGAEGDDGELVTLVRQWRAANRNIVRYWARMENVFRLGGRLGPIEVVPSGRDRAIVLPSGRRLVYRDVHWGRDRRATFSSPAGYRVDTYGGRLTENVTQAVARDVLAEALVRMEEEGIPVVSHVHDEVIIEGEYPLSQISSIMCDDIPWAAGLPLAAEGFHTDRYRKG